VDKYRVWGIEEIARPEVFRVRPLSEYGTFTTIADLFQGLRNLRKTVDELQVRLYEAWTMPERVVFDTNVMVSGPLWRGKPYRSDWRRFWMSTTVTPTLIGRAASELTRLPEEDLSLVIENVFISAFLSRSPTSPTQELIRR